jgi:DNA repair protein SbcD/Mre11
MKIIHFSDTHFGVAQDNGPVDTTTQLPGRVCDFLGSMDAMIDFAEDEKVDLMVFAGDLYHKHSPSPTLVREVGTRIVRAAAQCPVVLIPGNHDTPGSLDKASSVDVFSTLRVPNVFTYQDYGVRLLKSGIQIAAFPAPMKQHLLSSKEMRLTPTESTQVMKQRIADIIYRMEENIDTTVPSIFLGHLSVDDAKFGSEQSMRIGDYAEVTTKLLSAGPWDYVALGHLHMYQELGDNTPVVYSGSLDRIDFSEEKDAKGFVLITIEDDIAWEMIEVDARPMVTIRVDVTDTKSPTDKILRKIAKKNLDRAIVRMLIVATPRGAVRIRKDDIYAALKAAGVWFVSSMSIYEQVEVRSPTDSGNPITLMSRREQLQEYFSQIDIDERQIAHLLKTADVIMGEVNNDGQ